MSKYNLPKKFDYKSVDLLKQFITETGKIMSAKDTPYKGVRQHKSNTPKKSK